MEYDKLIEDIFSRHPSVQVSGFGPKSYKAGLEAMRGFDAQLGSPWRKYRIIHVAGTNGKGSVSSMLASCLAASGLSVGRPTCWTSAKESKSSARKAGKWSAKTMSRTFWKPARTK